jgi:hypothetical protein
VGKGPCPFEEGPAGWTSEELAKAVDSILNANRTKPSVQEVTPCSEYSRFTVEGILGDPLDQDRNAVFETTSLGALFRASRFREKKWSDPLSYGMALEWEDIRVHLQGKGKVIVRRARDKEEANRLFLEVADLMWPSVYCSIGGHTLADTLKSIVLDECHPPDCLPPMLEWPVRSGRMVEPGPVLDACRAAFNELGPGIEGDLRSLLHGVPEGSDAERMGLKYISLWSEREMSGYDSREHAMGVRTFFVMAERASGAMARFADSLAGSGDAAEGLAAKGRQVLSAGLEGKICPIDLAAETPEDAMALRQVWKSVRSVAGAIAQGSG